MAMPSWSRPKIQTAAMPNPTATSDPGTTGATSLRPITMTSEMTPTMSVGRWVWLRPPMNPKSSSKKSPSTFSIPNSLGNWPTMMVSARPMMKPFRTGSEMKLARNPRRARPATRARRPTHSASPMVIARKASDPPAAKSPTAAADRAAVAAIGPVTRCRELPNAA